MAQIKLDYSAAQINAAIKKINGLIYYIYGNDIVQLQDSLYVGGKNIYPRTKAEVVFFSQNPHRTVEDLENQINGETVIGPYLDGLTSCGGLPITEDIIYYISQKPASGNVLKVRIKAGVVNSKIDICKVKAPVLGGEVTSEIITSHIVSLYEESQIIDIDLSYFNVFLAKDEYIGIKGDGTDSAFYYDDVDDEITYSSEPRTYNSLAIALNLIDDGLALTVGNFSSYIKNGLDIYDISKANDDVSYENLSSALLNVPAKYQKGGISIKYKEPTEKEGLDYQYVQYRLIAPFWTTENKYWQKYFSDDDKLNLVIDVTTAELRQFKGDGKLISGTWYRVTDYLPTVTDSSEYFIINGTDFHFTILDDRFDICVMAVSQNDFAKRGIMISKGGDNIVQNFVAEVEVEFDAVPAWAATNQLWITWMKDKAGNEAPYDFLSIGFIPDGTIAQNDRHLPQGETWLPTTGIQKYRTFGSLTGDSGGVQSKGEARGCKLSGYNIIIGCVRNAVVNGRGSIIHCKEQTDEIGLENLIIQDNDNLIYCNDTTDEKKKMSGSIIGGSSNVVVSSHVHIGHGSHNNVIKAADDSYTPIVLGENCSNCQISSVHGGINLGNGNTYIEIDDASVVTIGNNNKYWDIKASDNIVIGNNNSDWDINYAANVYIGNHNIHTDSFDDTNYIRGGYEDGERVTVRNIIIGNYNSDIYLYAVGTTTIGNANKRVVIRYFLDGYQSTNVNIGNNNTISIIDAQDYEEGVLSHITIGNNNNVIIRPSDNQYIEAYITIGNYNYSPSTYLNIGLSDVGKFCYFDGTNWQFKTY